VDTSGNRHRQQKRGGNFWFLSPLFTFMDYILHMSFHICKQGSTLNMPIAAIENTKLFVGIWLDIVFDLSVFIYKSFSVKKSSYGGTGDHPTNSLASRAAVSI
jgi:hypothetical protein